MVVVVSVVVLDGVRSGVNNAGWITEEVETKEPDPSESLNSRRGPGPWDTELTVVMVGKSVHASSTVE